MNETILILWLTVAPFGTPAPIITRDLVWQPITALPASVCYTTRPDDKDVFVLCLPPGVHPGKARAI